MVALLRPDLHLGAAFFALLAATTLYGKIGLRSWRNALEARGMSRPAIAIAYFAFFYVGFLLIAVPNSAR